MSTWKAPFQGLAFFLSNPNLWGWAFLSTLVSLLLTFYACFQVIAKTFPTTHESWFFYFWRVFQSLGWGFFTLVLMVIVVFPFIFSLFFAKGLSKYVELKKKASLSQAFFSSFSIFFRTLRWRVLWPIVLLVSIFFFPFLTLPISFIAANHLAVLEGADLSFSLYGWSANQRVEWIKSHGPECFAIALSASFLFFLLSFTLIGWILWIPAVYSGVFRWVQKEQIGE